MLSLRLHQSPRSTSNKRNSITHPPIHCSLQAGPQGLINASKVGNIEVVKALMAAGAHKEAKSNVRGVGVIIGIIG